MIVGITGHQNLSQYNVVWIKLEMLKLLDALPVTLGISNLAAGSDQLFANIIVEKKISLKAIIPCSGYEGTFTNDTDFSNFKYLFNRASEKLVLDFSEPSEMAFFAAGKAVVENCNLLIAIWDGHKAKGLGGTGDVVAYALKRHLSLIHFNPLTERLIYYNYGD
ncbi:hypothetical protein FFF34_003145 [Inquilinus sp. KBS0705]|nr:hypothetical protein FFF34_003145 [Inquilinus sp. KBS0705]